MALSPTMLSYASANVLVPGTSVAVSTQPPDNAHTILVTNPSPTLDALIGNAVAPAPLTAGENAQRVPAGRTVVLGVGPGSYRGPITDLVGDAIGGAVRLEVTYVNDLSGS